MSAQSQVPPVSSKRRSTSSPAASNMTGTRRVANDALVEFHSTIEKWKNLYLQGCNTFKKLLNPESEDFFQARCEELMGIGEKLDNFIEKLNVICVKLENLVKLSTTAYDPMSSWSYEDFSQACKLLTEGYSKETRRKLLIVKEVERFRPLSKELDALWVAWVQFSSINEEHRLLMQALLFEAKLK